MTDKLTFDTNSINTGSQAYDALLKSGDSGGGAWYLDGSGLLTYDPGIPSGTYEGQAQSEEVVTGGSDPNPGEYAIATSYTDNSQSEAKEVVLSLTEAGLALATRIMQATGASPDQAKQQVKMKYANDPSIVTIKEKTPVWMWIAIGVAGFAALSAAGVLVYKKTRKK